MAKNKQNKTSKALVVYSQPAPNQQKKTKKKKKTHKSPDGDLSQYRSALLNPFSPVANGARVPDMYCVPTATRHITKVITVTTNSIGEFDAIVMPSAYWQAISTRGSLVGGQDWKLLNATTVPNGVIKTFPPDLATQLTNYRIVGYGVKVMGVESLLNAGGRICSATTPISSWCNEYSNTLGGVSTDVTSGSLANMANTLNAYGLPSSVSGLLDISALPAMPNSVEVPAVRLSENPLYITPKISSAEAFDFRQSKDQATGFSLVNHTPGTVIVGGDSSYLRLGGFEAVAITGSGLTPLTAVMDIEVIYHLEGNPFLSSSSIIGSDSHTAATVNPVGWMNIIQSVAKQPSFRDMVEVGGNTLLPGLGSLATRFM